MKVVAFVNNFVGLRSLDAIQQNGDTIVALVVHPQEASQYRDEILANTQKSNPVVIEATNLRNQATVEQIKALQPDIGVSAFFGHILQPEIIDSFPRGIVNVHPAYLPYNRGAYPNVWSIVDQTPAGATIHYIDKGVDTGDIIDRTQVEIEPNDTGESLYKKLESACTELFTDTWSTITQSPGKVVASTQDSAEGSMHRVRDTEDIDRIDLDKTYRAGDLLNIIRARTFSGYNGAYFEQNGEKYFLELDIKNDDTKDDN
jgi:methionyl-tRNA formyltransferase